MLIFYKLKNTIFFLFFIYFDEIVSSKILQSANVELLKNNFKALWYYSLRNLCIEILYIKLVNDTYSPDAFLLQTVTKKSAFRK